MADVLARYYEKAFEDAGAGGSHYNPMSVLERAGHDRKAELLAALELPDLSNAIVVDYGVGSWGFGCIMPALKRCKTAIGIDISPFAIECSKELSDNDPALAHAERRFFTSSGYDIQLEDGAADVVFAGECIEHIEDTQYFLREIWRVLKPGGLAIFTTPNREPYLHRQRGVRWAMGLEHVALMNAREFSDELSRLFKILTIKGYTSSLADDRDNLIEDERFARGIAKLGEDVPDHASGLIALVQKTDLVPKDPKLRHEVVEAYSVASNNGHRDVSLYEDVNGRMANAPHGRLSIQIPTGAIRVNLILWSHAWSGLARIITGPDVREVDLYSKYGGCVRITIGPLPATAEQIIIERCETRNPASQGHEVILFRAVFSIPAGP